MIRFSATVHIQKAHITASSENVPDFQCSNFKKRNTHYFMFCNQTFGIYLEPRKEIIKMLGQNH